MNDFLNQWLAERASTPGTLVCGLRAADGLCWSHAINENFSPEKMEKILHQLVGAQPLLSDNGLEPRWSTWVFEQAKIRSVLRSDGLLLAAIVRPNSDAEQNLGKLSGEFLALDLGG